MKTVLILGGTGFLGTNIAKTFAEEGFQVSIIDGAFFDHESRKPRLELLRSFKNVQILSNSIEECPNLNEILRSNSIIVDCMGWTAHWLALTDPKRDLDHNLLSHLHWLSLLDKTNPNPKSTIIYLGSRGQFGSANGPTISEESGFAPEDIQGIHKASAEWHFAYYSKKWPLAKTVSLRLPNCFGPYQPVHGEDLGLIGQFMRSLKTGTPMKVFGSNRYRNLTYAPDIAEAVLAVANLAPTGFTKLNMGGHRIYIQHIVEQLMRLTRSGTMELSTMPPEVVSIDVGQALFSETALENLVGVIPRTGFAEAFENTWNYFKQHFVHGV